MLSWLRVLKRTTRVALYNLYYKESIGTNKSFFLYFVNGSGLGGVRAARPQRHLTGGTLAQTSLENIAEEDLLDRRRRKGNSVERGLSERKVV